MIPVYAFVIVLAYSRMMYVEFTTSIQLPWLIRCHLAAFRFFGGWPLEILYDNMKQVRLGRDEWNPLFIELHRGSSERLGRAADDYAYLRRRGRVATIQWSPVSGTFSYSYGLDGRYATITFPNGQQREYQYDLQRRLTRLWNKLPGNETIADFKYGYDFDWTNSNYSMLGQRQA